MHKGLFAVRDIDNLDHNPSGDTARQSFHGKGSNLDNTLTNAFFSSKYQAFSIPYYVKHENCPGELTLTPIEVTEKYELSDDFAIVLAVASKK